MNLVGQARLDRSVFAVASLDDEDPNKAYWQTRSPQERLEALELLQHRSFTATIQLPPGFRECLKLLNSSGFPSVRR